MDFLQSTVSRAITTTFRCLSSPRICAQSIKFLLDLQEIRKNQEVFFKIVRFPGVVGAIDGAHMYKLSLFPNTETNISTAIITTASTHRLSLIYFTR